MTFRETVHEKVDAAIEHVDAHRREYILATGAVVLMGTGVVIGLAIGTNMNAKLTKELGKRVADLTEKIESVAWADAFTKFADGSKGHPGNASFCPELNRWFKSDAEAAQILEVSRDIIRKARTGKIPFIKEGIRLVSQGWAA